MSNKEKQNLNENPIIEEAAVDTILMGVVSNCSKLNVRRMPNENADVVCVIEAGAKVEINESTSDDKWLKVCTETGAEGFCMAYFISIEE